MRVSVYVPTRDKFGNKISYKETLKKATAFMCEKFGGCTTIKAHGYWINAEPKLTSEAVIIVESYTSDARASAWVKYEARMIKEALYQEAVAYTIDNEMLFV